MGANAFVSNQGTQTNLLTDNTGGVAGTLIPVMKLSTDAQGTFTNGGIWNGNVGVNSGTINISTISSLPNIPGGTLNVVAAGTINSATVTGNLGTIGTIGLATVAGNLGTIGTIGLATIAGNIGISSGTINVSTISSLPNLPQGSINVTAGTIASLGTLGTVGLATTQMTSGTLNLGTVSNQFLESSGSQTAGTANIITSFDVSAYRYFALQMKNTFVGTVNVQVSNDNSTFYTLPVTDVTNGNTGLITNINAVGLYTGQTPARFMKIVTGAYTSGTAQAVLENYSFPTATTVEQISGTVTTNASGGTFNAGTINTGTINTGTINTGTINVATVTGGTLQNLVSGTINAATAVLNNGTINLATVQMTSGTLNVATISTLPNLPQGSINVTAGTVSAGTINTGTLNTGTVNTGTINTGTVNVGSVVKLTSAPTAGSFTAAGTITVAGSQLDTAFFDIQGTYVGTVFFEAQVGTSTWFAAPAITPLGVIGTQTTGNGDYMMSMAGVDGVRARLTYSSGTLTYNQRTSNFFAPMQYMLGGTVGNVGMLNAGTISSLPNTPGGTINLATVQMSSGTLNVATISTLPNLPQGSINVTAGTIATLGTMGTLGLATTQMTSGTLNVGTINTGTVNTGTINVATVSAGTIHLAGTVLDNFTGLGTFTITLGTLASSGSVGRQSTLVDNTSNLWPAALIGCQITPGTVTTAGAVNIYLIRSDNGGGPIQDDLTGASDALATVNNAPLLGVIPINVGTNNMYKAVYDTSFLGHLGPKFGIVVQHALGNPFAVAGSQSITYQSIMPKFT